MGALLLKVKHYFWPPHNQDAYTRSNLENTKWKAEVHYKDLKKESI
jgi:hypothetical protein